MLLPNLMTGEFGSQTSTYLCYPATVQVPRRRLKLGDGHEIQERPH